MPHIAYEELNEKSKETVSKLGSNIKQKVIDVRNIQIKRYGRDMLNAHMKTKEIEEKANISNEAEAILLEFAKKFNLSPRSFFRMKKISRTIADLADSETVEMPHILEAFQYRPKAME